MEHDGAGWQIRLACHCCNTLEGVNWRQRLLRQQAAGQVGGACTTMAAKRLLLVLVAMLLALYVHAKKIAPNLGEIELNYIYTDH